jgi:hypothetical protein
MVKKLCVSVMLLGTATLQAECNNVHCRFEYLGSNIGSGYTEDSFLNESAVP